MSGKVECACPREGAYDCWRARYAKLTDDLDDLMSAEAVRDDGGPCQCVCHYEDEDDPEEFL